MITNSAIVSLPLPKYTPKKLEMCLIVSSLLNSPLTEITPAIENRSKPFIDPLHCAPAEQFQLAVLVVETFSPMLRSEIAQFKKKLEVSSKMLPQNAGRTSIIGQEHKSRIKKVE